MTSATRIPRGTRRAFLQGAAAAGVLAGCGRLPFPSSLPWSAPSPTPQKVHRVGWLQLFCPPESGSGSQAAFKQGMQTLGYIERQHYVIEERCGDDSVEALIEPAADLVRSGVDVIVAAVTAVEAVRVVTNTLPIVMVYPTDPVAEGIIASLARPGGNITGLTFFVGQLQEKRLDLLRDTVPGMQRVAVLQQGGLPDIRRSFQQMMAAASTMGIQLQELSIEHPDQFNEAFEAAAREGAQGLLLGGSSLFVPHRARIIALAAQYQLPAIYYNDIFVRAGGLMSYAPDVLAQYRRAAYYVDRVLKGTKPADLPVEQPREFELVINLQTAKALGLTIPYHVLLQATEVIE